MASRKKPASTPLTPAEQTAAAAEIAKAKQEIASGAQAVANAANKLRVPMDVSLNAEWQKVRDTANNMNMDFNTNDIDVRVMQVGPDGRLTDVSDRVNPRDVRPDQIQGFDSSDGSVRLPRQLNGEIDHDLALDLLGRVLGVSRRPNSNTSEPSAACREMEVLLADSDKLLKKLRR